MRLALVLAVSLATPALADLQLSSQMPGLDLVALSALPDAPRDQGETDVCSHLFLASASTPGGKDAAGKGWHVTAEAPLGDLTAVSFVGSATPATSGTCELLDGNVGLYSGGQLVALVYGTDREALRVGRLRPFGTAVRILSGDLLAETVADLTYDGLTLAMTSPAAQEPVCDAAGVVPAIEGLPIDQARRLLMQFGWQPAPGDTELQSFGMARDLAAAGVSEVGDCSGTGFGFCTFAYTGQAGELSVITAGEGGEDGSLPAVVRYGVDCR